MVVDLLDRQVELDAIAAAVERAATGHGSTVLVSGEAGIGKTSLVRSFQAAPGGARILTGTCEDLFTPRPLGPLLEAARATQGPLSEALRAPVDQNWLYAAVADELGAPPSPTVLVIEDAHWADGATIDVLRFLTSRVHTLPAVVMITFRNDELGTGHPLRSLLGGLSSAEATRLTLHRLSARSVSRMAATSGVDHDELFRLTGGNPFFVSEVLAFPEQSVPPTVVDAVLARVSALPADVQAALGLVAVVPSGVEVDLLRRLVDDLAPIALAEQAGVVEVRGGVVGFRHELARRAVVQSVPAIRQLMLNADVLDVLLHSEDPDPFRVLHHAREAANDEVVVDYGLVAALSASRMGAHRQAAACYQEVLSRGQLLEPARRARVAEAYAWALSNSNELDPAAGAAAEAVDGWHSVGDAAHLVRALVTLSRQQWLTESTAASLASAERALNLTASDLESEQHAIARLNLGGLLVVLDREEAGLTHLDRALELAERLRLPHLVALSHNYRGSGRLQLGDRGGEAELLGSIDLARSLDNHEFVLRAYYNLVEGLWRLGDLDRAAEHLAATEDYVRDRDFPVYTYMCRARRLRLAGRAGRWDEAAAGLLELVADREPGMIGRETLPFLARLRVRQGDPDAASLLDQAGEHVRRAAVLEWSVPVGLACIEHAWLTDDPDAAAPYPTMLLERTDRAGMLEQRGELMRYLCRLGLRGETFPGCPERYAAGIAGDWQEAARLWAEVGDPYERALELMESEQEDPLLEAIGILDGLGARPAADLARRRLRTLGVTRLPSRPSSSTRANPAGLTNRQVEILRLVGTGMSNAEIAGALVVSVRTVDHHVSAILHKLGTSNRREASARIAALGLDEADGP